MATRSVLPARRICTTHTHSFKMNDTSSLFRFDILALIWNDSNLHQKFWIQLNPIIHCSQRQFCAPIHVQFISGEQEYFFLCNITLNFNHVDIQRPILLASMTESSVRFYTRLHMREKIIPINTWKCIFITLQNLSNKS